MKREILRATFAGKALVLAGLMAVVTHAGQASGTVKDDKGVALAGVTVSVQGATPAIQTTTAADGSFSLATSGLQWKSSAKPAFTVKHVDGALQVQCPGEGAVALDLVDVNGRNLWSATTILAQGMARVEIPSSIRFDAAFLRARHGADFVYMPVLDGGASGWKIASHLVSARELATLPTLAFSKTGYTSTTYAMKSETEAGIAVTMATAGGGDDFKEDHRSECTIPALPAVSSLTNISNLPDPFTMLDGTKVTTKEQWKCRREEIAAMLEKYVHGEKPRNPEKVEGSFSGGKLTVKVTDKGKSISFSVSITKPSGAGPFPAIIGWDGGSIGGYSGLAVAKISYGITTIAAEGSGRGAGLFYDLYGKSATASELMAHAWGLSRIIDALEKTPEAGIDPKHLAVTGCSRWGKSSAISGSFDQRVQLVIPQESGSGGVSAWRMLNVFTDAQPIKSTYDEQFWTRQDFYSNFGSSINKLPVDHHEMIGMIAPRGLLILDNSIAWLGPQAGWGTANVAKEIFTALGASESITYSSVGGHTHCTQPSTQDHWVKSYVQKFLLGGTGESAKMEAPSDYKYDKAKWITWTTPTLK
ncbi:MAG TPA: carboxypeptidase-like regulatory domain-containing protein [Fibrobacteria bacterium]|nr:carboxypeptidase-like regulatory domain-containing protein [Fibrobacteria bacterium]